MVFEAFSNSEYATLYLLLTLKNYSHNHKLSKYLSNMRLIIFLLPFFDIIFYFQDLLRKRDSKICEQIKKMGIIHGRIFLIYMQLYHKDDEKFLFISSQIYVL